MIVCIRERSSLSELHLYLEPSTPPDEQKADLACLIAIPPRDRRYDPQERTWIISNAASYTHLFPFLKESLHHISAEQAAPFRK